MLAFWHQKQQVMKISWISMFLIFQSMLASSGSIYRECDHGVIKNKITQDLYTMELGLEKLIMEEGRLSNCEKWEQIPIIMHLFLSSKYQEVEESLNQLITEVSFCVESNLTGSVYIPEAALDFSRRTLHRAKLTRRALFRLTNCTNNATMAHYTSPNSTQNCNPCPVDGTKCQFSHCAQGNKLTHCAIGFAAGTTGGADGSYYVVTSHIDNPKNATPGTLRHAVKFAGENPGGAWIVFKKSVVINLKEKLWVNSNMTIDGRGVNVSIRGKGLVLARVENVILHNFEVVSTGESDTIHIFDGSNRVWIDHLSSRDGKLGLVTVLQGSTDVTISNCYLSNHNFNMLLGASDEDTMDQVLRVTVYRNWFDSSKQRMPHCRWGYCHVVNNYYKDWNYYAIGGRAHAKVLSEMNVFEPGRRLEVTPWFEHFSSDLTPTIKSSNDLLLKGATFHEFLKMGTLSAPQYKFHFYYPPARTTDRLVELVTSCAGVLLGPKLDQCLATP